MASMTTFRCRKCRVHLFSVDQLELHVDRGVDRSVEGPSSCYTSVDRGRHQDLSSFESCSSWFLKDEGMLPWIAESVEKAQWTEGKIYCPKCKSRIGAFDFVHGIQCNCGKFAIPAIWIQKSRVDHIFPKTQLINLDIRKPVYSEPSILNHSENTSLIQNMMDLSGTCSNADYICSSQIAHPGHAENGNEGQDSYHISGQAAFLSNTCQSFHGEASLSSCDKCEQCWNYNLLREPHANKGYRNRVGNGSQTNQRPSAKYMVSCMYTSDANQELQSNSSSSRRVKVTFKSNEGSRRIRKGRRHQSQSFEGYDLDIHEEISTESLISQGPAADKNTYSCLTFDEPIAIRQKVVIPEIQERHCCAVCLDLLYEPFKCSCDHVFCDPCLRQLNFRTGNKGTIKCPLCRQMVEHVTPASELRTEIRSTYDSHILRKREKAERRAPYRKWPLPSGHSPLRRVSSRAQRSVTLSPVMGICIVIIVCACVYALVLTVVVQVVSY